jgi:hypothetical protein
MATVTELRKMAHDLYARARASRNPFTKQKFRKSADDYLEEAEQLRRGQKYPKAAFPKKLRKARRKAQNTSIPFTRSNLRQFGSREIAANVLMQNGRFSPQSGEKPGLINVVRQILIPPFGGSFRIF